MAVLGLNCRKEDSTQGCIRGKLVIKGVCGNSTIEVMDGGIDSNLIVQNWDDPSTSKIYKNVFALKSFCTFPGDIKEGDVFYFTIDTVSKGGDCIVCLAYRPTPPKGLMINVCR